MGFLDNVSRTINKGTAAGERTIRATQLRKQLGDLTKQRQNLAAQLGATLYEQTKDNAEFTTGRESLYTGIANIDTQKVAIEAELVQLEQAAVDAATLTCPRCGARVEGTDLFCSGCGMPVEEIKAAYAQPVSAPTATCPACGAPITPGDAFCMSCGQKL